MLRVSPIQAERGPTVKLLLQRSLWSLPVLVALAGGPSSAAELESAPKPLRMKAARAEGRNVTVSWEGGAAPYQLYAKATLTGPWVEVDAPTDSTSLTAVRSEQMAFFRVSSGRAATTDRKSPTTPGALRATPLDCNQISLSWSSASDTGAGVKGYMVYRDGVFLKTVLAPGTSTIDTTTDGGVNYSYSIRSYDFANNLSPLSSPVTATTPACEDLQAPTAPMGVVATAVTTNQVDLRWQASTDGGGSGLAGYLVFAGSSYIGASSTPYYSARGLASGRDHCFTIMAYDGNGNSSHGSPPTCARTPAAGGPANDSFAGRLSLLSSSAEGNNFGASKEAGEPHHAGNSGGKSVWWTWTAPTTSEEEVIISTVGSSFDTLLGVYTGAAAGGLVPVVSNDNEPGGDVTSLVRFQPEAGANYAIAVDGKGGASGTIRLSVTVCSTAIYPLSAHFAASGGSGTVSVGTAPGCPWIASSAVPWISVTFGASGLGNGPVGFSVQANPNAAPRSGSVVVAGHVFTVSQDGAPCGATLSQYTASYSAAGGDGSVAVTASASDCAWTAVPSANWITITSGSTGTGSRPVAFRVAANPGTASRSGGITIAGRSYTISQAGAACAYSLSASGASLPHAGGSGSVNVTTAAGCNWSAVSDQSWLTITSGGSGSGNGTVGFAVAANAATTQRSGVLTIAGHSYTVTQAAGPCTFTVTPLTTNLAASGGVGNLSVSSGAGCQWTATSQAAWISVTAGASGSANNSVGFSVAANPNSTARSGTLLVAGRTVTINQAGTPCSYALSQASVSLAAAAGSGSFNVTAGIDCAWSATPSAGWITITSGAGPGNNTVRYAVSANTAATPRSGAITVGDRTFSLSQAGVACSYSLSAPSSSVSAAGGTGSVNVTAPAGCAWAAVTNAPWLRIVSGGNGNGNGTISYSAAANTTAAARNATITVGGQTYTVSQPVETTAPPVPTGLSALAVSCSDINVAWNAVTDQGGSGLRGYRLYRNGQFLREVPATATALTDSGLVGSTTYSYTVEAVDNANNRSAQSSAAQATTTACPAPTGDWARTFGAGNGDNGQALAVDPAGNIVMGGYFSGTVDLGAGSLGSGTTYAFFLAKYRPDGGCIWSKRFSVSVNSFSLRGVALDANQNIYIAGYYSGTAEFGGAPLTSVGSSDVFLAKFDSTGRHLWSRSFGGAESDLANGLAVDGGGNAVIVGYFMGTANFGGAPLGAPYTGMHAFLAKYDSNGAHAWSKDFDCSADHSAASVAVDSASNVYITGSFSGLIDFGGGYISAMGGADVYLAKFSAAGAHIWSQGFGGIYADQGSSITIDSSDHPIITGIYYYQGNFGGQTFNNPGSFDIFIAKYTTGGAHVWSKSVGSMSMDMPYGITTDRAQNVLVVGYFQGSANFGGAALAGKGGYDIFIAKYGSNGAHLWSERAGENGSDVAYAVAADPSNNVIVSGNFQNTITVGTRTFTSAGSYDGFIYRRSP